MSSSSALRRAALLLAAWTLAGCATPAVVPDKPASPAAEAEAADEPAADEPEPGVTGLRFEVEPAEAEILIGGQPYGAAVDSSGEPRTVELPPGLYQVSIVHAGYVTWRAEVSVSDATEVIRVSLVKR